MENGPEMSPQTPNPASSTDEETVADISTADVASPDAETVDGADTGSTDNQPSPDTESLNALEAPAPQPVQLFDMGDDLGVAPPATTPGDADKIVDPIVISADDLETDVIDIQEDVNVIGEPLDEETVDIPDSTTPMLPADDEIFEQVMGSSRVEDIQVPRRSTPGSIPLPPQLAEEQARRERTPPPASTDPRGRRHPLPETGRNPRRPDSTSQAAPNPTQPIAPQAVDVICPKCQRTTSTRFTFCMKCGTDFPPGYVASLIGHHPQPATPSGRSGVRDTRTTVRQINNIHEGRGGSAAGGGMGTAQTSGQQDWSRVQSGLSANPFLVAFLSFLMPGLGHMLIGEHKKGLPWLFAGIAAMAFLPSWTFLMWIPLFLRVFSAINAYQLTVIKQDEQREPFDSDDDA